MNAALPAPQFPYPHPDTDPVSGVHYPSSDGLPMAENDAQRRVIHYGINALELHYMDEVPDAYVSGDLLVYYREGDPRFSVAPDVLVAFGVGRGLRRSYRVWQEGKVPDFVMEVASEGTYEADEGEKRDLYARLGVREYWQFDPTGRLLSRPLKGGRLRDGAYDPMAVWTTREGRRCGYSEVLGLYLCGLKDEMRFHDPKTGRDLPSPIEERRAHLREQEARLREQKARRSAETQAEEARAEAERARARIAELEALLRQR